MSISSTIGTYVAANHNKVKGTGHMGTRELMHVIIYTNADTMAGYTEPNSLYAQLVRSIQLQAEVYMVGVPGLNFPTQDPYNAHAFTVVIAFDNSTTYETQQSIFYDGDINDINSPGMTNDQASAQNPNTKILSAVVADILADNGLPNSEFTDYAVIWAPLVADLLLPAIPATPKP